MWYTEYLVSQWLTELGKTDFYFHLGIVNTILCPSFRNCWYYSLLLISGNFFLQMLLFFVSPPLKHWRISAQTSDKTRRDVWRYCIWSSWKQNLYMEQKKILEDILLSHFLNQGCNSICCCSAMFYNDPHKLTQLHPSSTLGLVLPMWLQNLPAVLAGESLLACSLSCFYVHP